MQTEPETMKIVIFFLFKEISWLFLRSKCFEVTLNGMGGAIRLKVQSMKMKENIMTDARPSKYDLLIEAEHSHKKVIFYVFVLDKTSIYDGIFDFGHLSHLTVRKCNEQLRRANDNIIYV